MPEPSLVPVLWSLVGVLGSNLCVLAGLLWKIERRLYRVELHLGIATGAPTNVRTHR